MVHPSSVRLASCAFASCAFASCAALVFLVPARAQAWDDYETDLLRKFQRQSQKNTLDVKSEIEKNLADALAIGASDPEKALALVRKSKELLDSAGNLPRADRDELARKLDDGFRDARARLESKQEAAKRPAPTEEVLGGAVQFQPNIGQVKSTVSSSFTPTVSPDRRWVRLSFSGGGTILSGIHITQLPVRVPTLVQGPRGTLIQVGR